MTVPESHDDAGGHAGLGLWIRVAANLADRKVTWRLVEMIRAHHSAAVPGLGAALPLDMVRAAAVGYLVQLWGNIADNTPDGSIASLPASQLEHWAGWNGPPGEFYRWLRESHYDATTGKVREWDAYAGALQEKRASNARRQREKRQRDKQRGEQIAAMAAAASVEGADSGTAYALRLVVAANKGMNDNTAIAGMYNPLTNGRGDSLGVALQFLEAGMPVDFAERGVYTFAKRYKPEKRGEQIRSLNFFTENMLTRWEQEKARAAAAAADPIAELATAAKPVRGADARAVGAVRSAAGALAAADAVGLPDAPDTPPYHPGNDGTAQ